MNSAEMKEWPEPGIVKNSPIYGNYVVASRRIEKGEVIIEDSPLLVAPYGPSQTIYSFRSGVIHLCLNCCERVSSSEKCPTCKWPLCANEVCEVR